MVEEDDDAKMHASHDLKHSAYVNLSGALLQRTNKVTLLPKGTGCEMQVVSNYSGWERNDQGDFKKRVDDAPLKLQTPMPAEPHEAGGRHEITRLLVIRRTPARRGIELDHRLDTATQRGREASVTVHCET